ncbi:MAG: hypothetical protein IT379_43025 [Deltaproteobacteria bacterium]|nr:hypothetical protein [Deltaproteobacteria bacterium]
MAALFDALAEAGDERWFAVEPVATTGSSTPEPQVGPPPATPDAPTRAPAKAAAILSELEERAERDGHDLGARSRSDVGRWPSSDLETTLREHEGLRLHGGALELFPTRGRCSLANATDAARRLGAEPREGERVFAVSPGLGVFWAVTPEGTVRGLARTGLRYGPGAPFAQWLRDLAADLDEAVEHPDRPWAASLLGR